jgi:hypothetical protein
MLDGMHGWGFSGNFEIDIDVEDGKAHLATDGSFLYGMDQISLVRSLDPLAGVVVDPEIEVIGSGSVLRWARIREVEFPPGSRVTEIWDHAFSFCRLFARIVIPGSVKVIGKMCFASSASLAEVCFEHPSQTARLEESAFAGWTLLGICQFRLP